VRRKEEDEKEEKEEKIDVGITKIIDDEMVHVKQTEGIGTYNYISPEAMGKCNFINNNNSNNGMKKTT
jgi:hypothetical protein